MITREDLRRLYDGELADGLRSLENDRQVIRRAWAGFAIAAVVAVAVAWVVSRMNLGAGVGGTLFIAVIVLPFYVLSRQAGEARARRAQVFGRLVSDVARHVLPGATWGSSGRASVFDQVRGSGIFDGSPEDCETIAAVSGAAQPPGLLFSEFRLYRVKEWRDDAGRDRQHETTDFRRVGVVDTNRRKEIDVFRGLFIGFDLGTTIRGTTFADPKRVGRGIASRDALEPVAFEDPEFERVYRVTTSEPEEARGLLPPSARAGLLGLRDLTQRPVHVSLSEGRVGIAIDFGKPLFEMPPGRVGFEDVARMADLFGLAEAAAAALPLGVPLASTGRAVARRGVVATAAEGAESAPARPATSMTRLTRRSGGLSIEYTRSVSRLALAISALSAPLLAWFWWLAVREFLSPSGDKAGVAAAMIPLALASAGWLFAGQAWWGPLRRVDVDAAEIGISRGLLRRQRMPTASVRTLVRKGGLLLADGIPLTPELRADELEWLLYEIGRVLPSATSG